VTKMTSFWMHGTSGGLRNHVTRVTSFWMHRTLRGLRNRVTRVTSFCDAFLSCVDSGTISKIFVQSNVNIFPTNFLYFFNKVSVIKEEVKRKLTLGRLAMIRFSMRRLAMLDWIRFGDPIT